MKCDVVDGLLLEFVEGELPADQKLEIQEHLDKCPACAARRRETAALLGDLSLVRSSDGTSSDSIDARTLRMDTAAAAAPERIGDFKIIEELGRGGMGVVYRARQISLNRIVALKLLSGGLAQNERSISRFAREAQAAARLHHTNIVPVYAQGREGNHVFYAMELIEGQSLDIVLRGAREDLSDAQRVGGVSGRRARPGQSDPSVDILKSAASTIGISTADRGSRSARDFKRIARLMAEVADGLDHAHQQGVIHRDIKPQNLLLGPDDRLHITDFGLARLADEPGLTLSSEMVGTPAYMSPEQISKRIGEIDQRTDIYALGVALYEMLTLRRPFHGETYEQVISQILHRDPRPPRKHEPRTPQDLETICLRAMEKEPHRRFRTASDMARDLRRYADGFPIASRPLGPLGKTLRWVRRKPWHASAIAAMVLLMVAAPVSFSFLSALGDAQIDSTMTTLLEDYRDKDLALAQLGWASHVAGDSYRREFAEAFAHIRTEPERTIELLERALSGGRKDSDAHYMLAWAYARQTLSYGAALWAEVEKHIRLGDAYAETMEPSAAGYFFKGQALFGVDPRKADEAYAQAIRSRTNFTQAMLHKGRAMNQIMYSWRDNSYYRGAVGMLEHLALMQPTQAYPRYLLSLTHQLAAEIFANQGDLEQSAGAYKASLAAAKEAQFEDSRSPRGYAAEAGYHESRGFVHLDSPESRRDFQAAIAAWNWLDNSAIRKSASDNSERYKYQMRLCFWLGDYAEAERLRRLRFSATAGYDRETHYDADESLYEALLLACRGETGAARRVLDEASRLADVDPEGRLLLVAAYQLIGANPPAGLIPRSVESNEHLSPGWTIDWLNSLARFESGELGWEDLEAAQELSTNVSDKSRLRNTSAHFFRGAKELSKGNRGAAIESLEEAANQRDNEHYCFRAKLLLVRMKLDPDWPAWIENVE